MDLNLDLIQTTELGLLLMMLFLALYFFICLLTLCMKNTLRPLQRKKLNFGRILIVTAHPDDECMFFGPTIVNLVRTRKSFVYVLCLSAGGYEGKSKVRKQEFWSSCTALGLEPSNIMLTDYEKMRDDPNREWPGDLVRETIVSYVKSYDIDTIVTFDKRGVSGHRNHCAIYETIKEAMQSKQWPTNCRVFTLQSINLFRKYLLSIMDVWYSYFTCGVIYLLTPLERTRVKTAMNRHRSQLTWYRRLYITFSRYMLINSLVELRHRDEDEDDDSKKDD